MLHQALAARVFAGGFGDGFVEVGDSCIERIGVRQEVADTQIGLVV